MSLQIFADADARPRLFRWHEPIDPERIAEWLRTHNYVVPESLAQFWETTGGGDLFESETVFAPRDHADDDIDDENDHLRTVGLPNHLLAFHRGYTVCAIDQRTNEFVELEPVTFSERRRYATLDEWYADVLRQEFAERYGLPT
jgi:hypothetical protein